MASNIRLYPWFQFLRSLMFWQAIWFLYFQETLSGAEAILLVAVFDIATTVLEVPSGYLSDRVGRRLTLLAAMLASAAGCLLLALGGSLGVFLAAQVMLGAGIALVSGTDTALLYESLKQAGRGGEVQRHELRAWRFGFSGLAISALSGGLMAGRAAEWAFLASAAAALAAAGLALRFTEPPRAAAPAPGLRDELRALGAALGNRTLGWLFVLTVGMYVLSHVPFVFGQPFILEALSRARLGASAPAVSGAVTAAMMLVSVGTSWTAPWLQGRLGAGRLFLAAMAIQIGLIGVLALTDHPLAIALLMLRMVPDSLAKPFVLARIHPLLGDGLRATYLSLQSLAGRLILAATLILSARAAPGAEPLAYEAIRGILAWYLAGGLVLLAGLAATIRLAR